MSEQKTENEIILNFMKNKNINFYNSCIGSGCKRYDIVNSGNNDFMPTFTVMCEVHGYSKNFAITNG